MSRILRAEPGWEQALADALASARRPIPFNARFLPRAASDGVTTRERADRRRSPPPRAAATLLAIYPDTDGDLVVPLTVRRADLRAHAGEVSLPGGAIDPGEGAEEAALREAWEEVGLSPQAVRIVGMLDEVWIPVSNFEMRPFVGTVAARPALVPHDAEVASIVELPLRLLWDPEVAADDEFEVRGLRIRAGIYRFGGVRIWGATAITLGMLARVLDDAADQRRV
jgi:8-oxo-dGTP pyrophosphatase MutT (NUDIX family)